jgi:hypothetical protein
MEHGYGPKIEMCTIEVLAGKVIINEVFEPKSVWISLTVLSSNQIMPSHVTKRSTNQIKLASSYANQWMFRGTANGVFVFSLLHPLIYVVPL